MRSDGLNGVYREDYVERLDKLKEIEIRNRIALENKDELNDLLDRLSKLYALLSATSFGFRKQDGSDWYDGVDFRKEDRDFILESREVLPNIIESVRSLCQISRNSFKLGE